MTPEAFRQAGHELIDWIADYRSNIENYPVRAQVEPGDIRRSLSSKPPISQQSAAQMLDQLEQKIVPGITQVQSPMHFGWFPCNASLASTGRCTSGSKPWLINCRFLTLPFTFSSFI